MGLKTEVQYEAVPLFEQIIANNPNGEPMSAAKVLSGVGPFDFSGVADITDIEVVVQVDNAAPITASIDLTAAAVDAAVTVAEAVTAWATIATATGVTASTDTDTGRLKLAKTTLGSAQYLQVTGEFARVCGFGYGYGAIIIPMNTQQSVTSEGVQRDSEVIEVIGSDGEGSSFNTNPKRTGSTKTIIDTASDFLLYAFLSGGQYNWTTGGFSEPLQDSPRPTFTYVSYKALYDRDDNGTENNYVKVHKALSPNCLCTAIAEGGGGREYSTKTYTIKASPYKHPVTKVRTPDTVHSVLIPEDYEALDLANV